MIQKFLIRIIVHVYRLIRADRVRQGNCSSNRRINRRSVLTNADDHPPRPKLDQRGEAVIENIFANVDDNLSRDVHDSTWATTSES